MMESKPLVTVGVITYNSSQYVTETLDSIIKQTYKNLELIISDDCSSDDTVKVIQDWILKNKNNVSFPIRLITVDKNTGTAGNNNRIIEKTNGAWLKIIAGDDVLPNYSIEHYVEYVNNNPEVQATFADELDFPERFDVEPIAYHKIDLSRLVFGKSATASFQHKVFSRRILGLGPTFFARTDVIRNVGGFDVRFPLIDDVPLFIKITGAGIKIHRIPEALVYYRVNCSSVSHAQEGDAILSKIVIRSIIDYKLLYFKENLSYFWQKMLYFSIFLHLNIINSGNSRKNVRSRLAYYIKRMLDPMDWYSRVLNIIDKSMNKLNID